MMQKSPVYPEFIGVRTTTSERQALMALAQREGLSLSGCLRELITKESQRSVTSLCGCGAPGPDADDAA